LSFADIALLTKCTNLHQKISGYGIKRLPLCMYSPCIFVVSEDSPL